MRWILKFILVKFYRISQQIFNHSRLMIKISYKNFNFQSCFCISQNKSENDLIRVS